MNLGRLRTFEVAARTGSFRKAASELSVTQPAISAQIRRLERDYGLALFERIGRRSRLTGAGESLQRYARRIFALVDEAEQTLQMTRGFRHGRLRIIASPTAAAYYVPPLLAVFKRRYPGIQLQVFVDNSTRAVGRLLDLEADVGVIGAQPTHSRLVRHELTTVPLAVIVAPSHPWARRRSVRLEDLAGQALVLREPGSATRSLIEARFAGDGQPLTIALEVGSNEALKRAVEIGVGIGIISRAIVAREVKARQLALLTLRGPKLDVRIDLVYHRDRGESPLVRAILETAQAFARVKRQAAHAR